VEQCIVPFFPAPDDRQMPEINTDWDTRLTAHNGDFLVREGEISYDEWLIDPLIFENRFAIIPGWFVKYQATCFADEIMNDPALEVCFSPRESKQRSCPTQSTKSLISECPPRTRRAF
jgi:hypothetical protein